MKRTKRFQVCIWKDEERIKHEFDSIDEATRCAETFSALGSPACIYELKKLVAEFVDGEFAWAPRKLR